MSKFEKILNNVKMAKTIAIDVNDSDRMNSSTLFSMGLSRNSIDEDFLIEIYVDCFKEPNGIGNLNLFVKNNRISIDNFLDWYLLNVYCYYRHITFGYSLFN